MIYETDKLLSLENNMQIDRTRDNLTEENLQITFEKDIQKWAKTSFERCVLNYTIDQMLVTISLIKGDEILSLKETKTIPAQIRISPSTEKVQSLFNKFFGKSEKDGSFIFKNSSVSKEAFQLHYFNDRRSLLNHEQEANKRKEQLKHPPLPSCFIM